MKWLLMLWLVSTDSGFPEEHLTYVTAPQYDSQKECLEAGANWKWPTPSTWIVRAYFCSPGAFVSDKH